MDERSGGRGLRERNEKRCERLVARAGPLRLDDLDWSAVATVELDPGAVACLVYMRDVEGFTNRDLVGLAGHPATVGDPLVRRFLDAWRSEEAGHARALDRFLRVYAAGRGIEVPPMQPPPPSVAPPVERAVVALSRPVGHVVTATHMAWGAVNELLTLTGYRLLARRCGHPVLAELLGRIATQEARHYGFYLLQTEWRLASSPLARAVIPRLLRRTWTPVGVGADYKSPDEFDRVLAYLVAAEGGDRSVVAMDAALSRLPGCAGLRLYAEATLAAEAGAAGRSAHATEPELADTPLAA